MGASTSEELRRRFEAMPGDELTESERAALADKRAYALEYYRRHNARALAAPEDDGYSACVVPSCWVWTRVPTPFGTCPRILWDERHDAWNAARMERRSS